MFEYRRSICLSSFPIEGSFKFFDEFQILPPDENFPQRSYLYCHHPFIIEYKFEQPKPLENKRDALPQYVHNNECAANKITEILLILTALSENYLFNYNGSKSWFFSLDQDDDTIHWGQQGYIHNTFNDRINSLSNSGIKEIAMIDASVHFNRIGHYTNHKLDLPDNIIFSLMSYYESSQDVKNVFLSAASLLHQGIMLWSGHPSLSFASIISSLETLIAYQHKDDVVSKCECCGQSNYQVGKKFRNFVKEFGSKDRIFKEFAVKIYDLRSKILHRGELFLGETKSIPFANIEQIYTDDMRRGVIKLARICLTNWLLSQKVA